MNFTVDDTEAGQRLDRFLAAHTGHSRAAAMRLIEHGQVRVGQRPGRKGMTLAPGDVVQLLEDPVDDQAVPPVPQPELPLHVLHQDDDVVVVNKPPGLPSHPLRAGERGTVASAVVARFPECASASAHPREGGVCHRLDIFTSGVLLFARHPAAWHALRGALSQVPPEDRADRLHQAWTRPEGASEAYTGTLSERARTKDRPDASGQSEERAPQVDKEYLALVQGVPVPGMEQGRVDLPLLPAPGGRGERVMVAEDRGAIYSHRALPAETRFRVERRGAAQALLRVFIHAGRRHQIRAHLSYLGLPIYGDTLYGGPSLPEELAVRLPADRYAEAQGPFLHAGLLRFPSPRDGRLIAVTAPLPAGRQLLLDLLFGAAS